MDNDQLLSQVEAAELLGISPSTMNGWRVQGRGPAFVRLTARCVRYRISDLERWVDAQRVVGPEAKRVEHATNS